MENSSFKWCKIREAGQVAFRLRPAYAGFMFALLWGGFHHAELRVIPQLLCASLLRIALAYSFQVRPAAMGPSALRTIPIIPETT
jgi:hypothetical protein